MALAVALAGNSIKGETITEHALWDRTAKVLLESSSWQRRDAYDAGHHLYVPLCAAFELGQSPWQADFRNHFSRFLKAKDELPEEEHLYLGYGFLAVRFCSYAAQAGQAGGIPEGLAPFWLGRLRDLWERLPAWQWLREPFAGFRQRLEWKLSAPAPIYSFERAVLDDDLWLFGIAAELWRLDGLGYAFGLKAEDRAALAEILEFAERVFRTSVAWEPDGRWRFQPGVWRDAPAHAQAGMQATFSGMPEAPREAAAWDSSHSYRFPVVLASLEAAEGGERARFYRSLRNGLARQFQEKVLVAPTADFPVWRMRNYMDGWNGVYEWEPDRGVGYGPYQLSGSLAVGLWSALRTAPVQQAMLNLSRNFPLPDVVVDMFEGPGTLRERHPLLAGRNAWNAGMYELICRLAARLPISGNTPEAVVAASFEGFAPPFRVRLDGRASFDPDRDAVTAWEWQVAGEIVSREPVLEWEVVAPVEAELRVKNAQERWSIPKRVEVPSRPAVVKLLVPNSLFRTSQPRFEWEPVARAARYVIELQGTELLRTNITGTRWQVPQPLEPGRPYVLTVAAAAGDEASTETRWGFSMTLPKPVVLEPSGQIAVELPKFAWAKVDGATRYLVHLVNKSSNAVLYSRFVAGSQFAGERCELIAPVRLPQQQLLGLTIVPGSELIAKGPASVESVFFVSRTRLRLSPGEEGWALEVQGEVGERYDISVASGALGPWTPWQSLTIPPLGSTVLPIPPSTSDRFFRAELRHIPTP